MLPSVTPIYLYKTDTVNLIPLFLCVTESDKIIISDEHCEYGWYNIEEAVEKIHWISQKNNLKLIDECLKNESLKKNLIEINLSSENLINLKTV